MSSTSMNLRINDLSRYAIVAKDSKVNDGLAIASLIRRSQAQCGAGNAVNLFEDFNMIFQFFSSSRHLGFEDIQAMVNLIADPRKILSLLISSSLHNLLIYFLFELNNIGFLSCNPLAPTGTTIQSVETQAILRCNEASSLTTYEVSFNSLPVNIQSLGHKLSL